VAVVTGATGGIGTAISRTLSADHDVVGLYHAADDTRRNAWTRSCRDGARLLQADLLDSAATLELTGRLASKVQPVVLVNCAGITDDAMFRRMGLEQWEHVLRTNLLALYATTQPIFAEMCEARRGLIVNIGSVNGERGQAGQCNYAAAKAGMHGFTMSLAREGARYGVRVVTVSPGYTATNMVAALRDDVRESIRTQVPLGRFAAPEEIAAVVGFLASPGGTYITGADIPVNGGLHIA
jgi:acetoacetyl-CoA reductase